MSDQQETPQDATNENMYQARCGDCHWFNEITEDPDQGKCLTLPPTPAPLTAGAGSSSGGGGWSMKSEFQYARPTVHKNDRCRLFLMRRAHQSR